jgi:hypothetical protein
MASNPRHPATLSPAKRPTIPIAEPRCPRDLVRLLRSAVVHGMADAGAVAHLAKIGALFPDALMDAYRAYRERQAGKN